MHRLAWDLKLISARPTKDPRPQLSPADWFHYIGGGGTSAIVVFLLACGYSAEEAREKFIEICPTLVNNTGDLSSCLEALLPRHESMWWDGQFIADLPARSNIWIAAPADPERPHSSEGNLYVFFPLEMPITDEINRITAGMPILKNLLPLVLAEVQRELEGETDTLNYTLPFLQSICPVFSDCSILVSLGSGDVPVQRPRSVDATSSSLSSYNPLSWVCASPSTPTHQEPAPLPSSRATISSVRTLNKYIPTSAYGQTYIRINPSLVSWSTSGVQRWPADWECEKFGEHKMIMSGFCSRYENSSALDSVVDVLKRKGTAAGHASNRRNCGLEASDSMQQLLFASAGYY
jgi:hypothetical protein